MVLNDFQRGKLPYYIKPPGSENEHHPEMEEVSTIVEENQQKTKKENKKLDNLSQ